MRIADIIATKRDSKELSQQQIAYFVKNYTNGDIADYQAAALLMAMYINGLNRRETVDLTMAMANSGQTLDLSGVNGVTVDKHSTGGVGDKTTLIVAPICAACGLKVAKMSGRGLGHTGGTIDKLESIPNFDTGIDEKEFVRITNEVGLCVVGQTKSLAPADKKLYALRDVTATVSSIPLIASSIMSKKIASGAGVIVLDCKCGSGAFMKNIDDARLLARTMVDIAKDIGRKCSCVISDMSNPLGTYIGNSLEVAEAVDVLNGNGALDLREVSVVLAQELISLALGCDALDAKQRAISAIDSGKAKQKFIEMVRAQKGEIQVIEDTEKFAKAAYSFEVLAGVNGYVQSLDSEKIGIASVELGAGRTQLGQSIDYTAGIMIHAKSGQYIKKGSKLCTLFSNEKRLFETAQALAMSAYVMGAKKTNQQQSLILDIIR